MTLQKTPTIGLVELPDFGLIDRKGENWLAGIKNKDRKGTVLISKQILLANKLKDLMLNWLI